MPDVRTPLATTTALELGHKLWRKQIIREGKIAYRGGEFDASPEYLDSVVASFRDKAIGSVPFVFVDDKGGHSEAPERRRGKVVGLERTPTGIDALLQLSDDAEKLVEEDPEFGVSVLIKHDRTTGEGKYHPAVLCHVAGTYDPVLSLQPWTEELAASNPGDDLLDLLALTSSAPRDETTRKAPMADTLAPEELAVLRSLLAKLTPDEPADPAATVVEPTDETAEPVAEVVDPDGETDDDVEFTDEEIAAMVASLDEVPADEPELVAASNDGGDSLELSHKLQATEQRNQDLELRLAQVEAKAAAQEYEAERLRLAQTHGIPPRITDIVRPLLEGTGGKKLALSNGSEVDPAALIRKFVVELASTPRLDLSQPIGSGQGIDIADDEEAAATERAALAKLAVQSMS
jgi:hypothetical protein